MRREASAIQCPRCRLINPPSAQRCECGWDLIDGKAELFRSGSTVVIGDCGTLPERCIKCNAPASGGPIKYAFVDSDVAGAPRGVISAIVHFGSRRTGRVYLHMCGWHRRLRALIRWGCPLLFVAAVAVGVYANVAFPKPPDALVNVAVVLTIASTLPLGIYQMHYLRGRVFGRQIWIDGAGPAFLDSLPAERPVA
jgi:hypothetical protein